MNPSRRRIFDRHVQRAIDELPGKFRRLLEQVTVIVEDYPSARVVREMELESRDELCGLHDGIPLTERSTQDAGHLSDAVYLFRDGIAAAAADVAEDPLQQELRRQIRVTLLHELGHHFGLDEEELEELGYG